ncbi:unnamed protein product [Schistosoma turkestanicum]|nr:unnamed protein product [Schistosoma turkestanicum]
MKRSDSASIRSTQQKTHHDNNIDKLTEFKKTPNSPCSNSNNNNNNNHNTHNNHNSNSPTFSIHSAPFLLNQQPNDTTQLTPKSTMYDTSIGSFSMTSVKEILERLKMEVEFERNKRTIIARQRNQDIHKLTTRSKAENRLLLCALKHAENKARMYRDEYHKLKTKGNKIDLGENLREVTESEGKQCAIDNGAYKFLETSAKNGSNVLEAFTAAVRSVLEQIQNGSNPSQMSYPVGIGPAQLTLPGSNESCLFIIISQILFEYDG